MSRIRSIKPEIWHSSDFMELDGIGQLTFIALITLADDEGRLKTNAGHLSRVAVRDAAPTAVQRQLEVMESLEMIRIYLCKGAQYIALLNWTEHQRVDKPRKSTLPEPPKRRGKSRSVANRREVSTHIDLSKDRSERSIEPGETAYRSQERDEVQAWLAGHGFQPDPYYATKLCVSEGWPAADVIAACEQARRWKPKRPLTYIQTERDGHSSLLSRVTVQREESEHAKRKPNRDSSDEGGDGSVAEMVMQAAR